jgi:hypothetical protein
LLQEKNFFPRRLVFSTSSPEHPSLGQATPVPTDCVYRQSGYWEQAINLPPVFVFLMTRRPSTHFGQVPSSSGRRFVQQLDLSCVVSGVIAGKGAGRVIGAAKKRAVFAKLDDQSAVFALRTRQARIHARLDLGHGFARFIKGWVELLGEVSEQVDPIGLSISDIDQALLPCAL